MDPINEGFTKPPKPAPLGWPFSNEIEIRNIRHMLATKIYEHHHSYLPRKRTGVAHHGIFYKNKIVGGITYSYALTSSPINNVPSDQFIEVGRVAVGIDMPNLASCAMAKSQKKFYNEYAKKNGIKMLVTWVRDDYEGSMFAALRGLGWKIDGMSEGGKAYTDRPERDIYQQKKVRWICMIS